MTNKNNVTVSIEFVRDLAQYIKCAQQTVEHYEKVVAAYNKKNGALQEKVAYAVGCLIDKGLAASEERSNLIRELTSYPEKIAEVLAKVSQRTEFPVLGIPSNMQDTDTLDPIAKFALEGPYT